MFFIHVHFSQISAELINIPQEDSKTIDTIHCIYGKTSYISHTQREDFTRSQCEENGSKSLLFSLHM